MMITIAAPGEITAEVAIMVKPDAVPPVMDVRIMDEENTKDHHANADQNMAEACIAMIHATGIEMIPIVVAAVIPSGGDPIHTAVHADMMVVTKVLATTNGVIIAGTVRVSDTTRIADRGATDAVGAMNRVDGAIRAVAVSMASRWGIGRTGGARHRVAAEREKVAGTANHGAVVPAMIAKIDTAATTTDTVKAPE
jgi:hypothetical protein